MNFRFVGIFEMKIILEWSHLIEYFGLKIVSIKWLSVMKNEDTHRIWN